MFIYDPHYIPRVKNKIKILFLMVVIISSYILTVVRGFSFLFFLMFYLFLRERECTSGGGTETQGNRGSKAGSTLTAVSPMWGSNS